MTIGQHIIVLRKKKRISQSALGKTVATSEDIIGRYERNEVKPSVEVVIKLADDLDMSVDFLVGKTSLEIDRGTLKRLEELSKLPEEAKSQMFMVVDALIRDFKAKQAYS